MKTWILICAIVVSGLTFAQEKSTQTPQIGMAIPLGTTIEIDDLLIEFVEVLEDSRCPKDVQCVWAGQAKVKLSVTESGMDPEFVELVFGSRAKDRTIKNDNFYIEGLSLTPYPTSETQGKLKYVLLLKKAVKTQED
ncbi:MAG: hypothetical protein K0U54_02315 [Bacteroidetes bacterium]|nr:hypothetical protein [Bacteroidota bacterium]